MLGRAAWASTSVTGTYPAMDVEDFPETCDVKVVQHPGVALVHRPRFACIKYGQEHNYPKDI